MCKSAPVTGRPQHGSEHLPFSSDLATPRWAAASGGSVQNLDWTPTQNDLQASVVQTTSIQSQHSGRILTAPLYFVFRCHGKQAIRSPSMSPLRLMPYELERSLTSVCAASRALDCPSVPNYLVHPAQYACNSCMSIAGCYKYHGQASKLLDTARLVPVMTRHAVRASSGRTAHAGDADVLVAAIVPGPEARFTPERRPPWISSIPFARPNAQHRARGSYVLTSETRVIKTRLWTLEKHSTAPRHSFRWLCESVSILFSGGLQLSCLACCGLSHATQVSCHCPAPSIHCRLRCGGADRSLAQPV